MLEALSKGLLDKCTGDLEQLLGKQPMSGEDDGDVGNSIVSHRARRTDSTEGDFTQNATIPTKAGRSKSRGRQSSKLVLSSNDATIVELQQRLELMAREKVSLESAIEQEQERV
ncbi:hypothetical protein GGF45_006245, partial [Coemansia sp. RSA 551]